MYLAIRISVTAWCRVYVCILGICVAGQGVPHFMEPEFMTMFTTVRHFLYLAPDESNLHNPIRYKIHVIIILPSTPRSSKCSYIYCLIKILVIERPRNVSYLLSLISVHF